MKKLVSEYRKKREEIRKRLEEFRQRHGSDRKEIFEELCFCLFTPQSKAVSCDKAVKDLKRSGLLFKGDRSAIRNKLKGVRFPNNKTEYLLCARTKYRGVRKMLRSREAAENREWLVQNIKGMGYKEASHFLRNIGLGRDMAILDVHILKNLKRHGVIGKIPASMSKKAYLDIEERMRRFSKRIKIPLDELDLLFWSQETGLIFK